MNPETPTAPRPFPAPARFWSRLGWSLWPSRCLVCDEPGLPGCDLCAACWTLWPRAARSCLGCAMPLVEELAWPEDARTPGPDGEDIHAHGFALNLAQQPAHESLQPGSAIAVAPSPDRCGACRRLASPLREVHAAGLYRSALERLLPRFKFHRDLAAGRVLATTMAAAFAPLAARLLAANADQATSPACDRPALSLPLRTTAGVANLRAASGPGNGRVTLVPIPLHRSRLRARGYDQTLELARPLARCLGLDLRNEGLRRVRDTPPQSRLDAARRRSNLREAFAWTASAPPPAHAILVDDVMTTGATLHAAALALRRAGAQRVDAWVCARTL